MDNKENLFLTKHVAAVFITFFITSIAPVIDKGIAGTLTGKDIAFLINSGVVALLAGATKGLDKNVYTPKYLPGRDKEDALSVIYVEPTVVNEITKDPVVNQIASTISNPINLVGKSSAGSSHEQNTTGLYLLVTYDTWLKKEPVQSSLLPADKKMSYAKGDTIEIEGYGDIIEGHITVNGETGVWYAFKDHVVLYKDNQPVSFSTVFMPTQDQLSEIYGSSVTNALYTDFKNCLTTFGIETPEDICHFIGQTGHESAGLYYTKEIASGDDYEWRDDLGNVQAGDGRKYKGAGFIQLTGRYNYQRLADYLQDPRVMEGVSYVSVKYPFTSAGYWWYDNKMSDYINKHGADIYAVSKAVNGGLNGIYDRIYYFTKAKEILGVD